MKKEIDRQCEDGQEQIFDETAFRQVVPVFSFSVDRTRITVRIGTILGSDSYEVYQSPTPRGRYKKIVESSSPVIEFCVPDGKLYYYKVRAFHGSGEEKIPTKDSRTESIDLVSAGKLRNERLDSFFRALENVGEILSFEDLDIAVESLKVAGLEVREKEERRRAEENAEKVKKEIEARNKRRQAAAERAAARREKKRLEHVDEVTRMELPIDYVNAFGDDDRASVHCETLSEALMTSLDMLGLVDIEFIAAITGKDMKTVIENLRGSIYQNPLHWNEVFYKGWETADEYLSGNLMHKYMVAKEANEQYNGYFQNNVTALEGILDPEISSDDIYVSLGSPWVPTDIIDDFIGYLAFGGNLSSREAGEYYAFCRDRNLSVRHDEYTGYWEIPRKSRFRESVFHGMFEEVSYKTYGTERMDMLCILENTLNMKTLSVYDMKDSATSGKKIKVLNQEETVKLLEKQKQMISAFQDWVWQDEQRRKRLQSAYSRKYGNVRKRFYDGSFLELPGLSDSVRLYDYQKNAVARILFSPNTLLAHEVGSGKTYVMIAAGMELRRLGKSAKNLYVIPNNLITQWEKLFREMYPAAKLLTVSHGNFSPDKRGETLTRIKNEDFDAILMTYSCFDMLPLSDKYYIKLYQERLDTLDKATKNFYSASSIEKKRKVIRETLDKLRQTYKNPPKLMPFDELGINTLFLDEAHNYKNVDLESRISRVRGTGSGGSAKGNCMMDKVHCVQRMNNGGRIVFATGTPITNSISDLYVMQKYLQEGELDFLQIRNFDAWAGMYAEKTTEFEIDVDTNSFRLVTRFSRFRNIPELSASLSSVIDFHKTEKSADIPLLDGYSDSLADGSDEFRDYLREISNRADDIRQARVSIREDNMLKVTSDGRKAALDMRLIDTAFGLEPDSKIIRCADNVCEEYLRTRSIRGTQLIFCDISTPKAGFNLYDEMKLLLIASGIPENEIAFIHDAGTDSEKEELFRAVREGEIAVLIGSTAKMGHGMNVQKHLTALHHFDVPWKPSDMVQREGRILRKGNENQKVRIFRYVTRGSFDAYSWQLLETKQRFISQIMSGEATMREGSDIDDTVLNYAEVKALAVGNEKVKRRVEVCNELDKYRILQRDYLSEIEKKRRLASELPEKIARQKERIENCEKDIELYRQQRIDLRFMKPEEKKEIREAVCRATRVHANSPVPTEVLTFQGFRVVVPAYMVPRKPMRKQEAISSGETVADSTKPIPYVHLVGNNTYYLEIESEAGVTARLRNLLDNLPEQKKKFEDVLLTFETKLKNTEEELQKTAGGYRDEIDRLMIELKELNEELDVKY